MGKSFCTHCQFSTKGAIIKCIVCTDIELCLRCFSSGAELGNHRRDHAYCVIDDQDFSIFNDPIAWNANEELLLLDAVEQYGFGNWGDIASHVETKSSDECIEHYGYMYIVGTIGRCTLSNELTCNVTDHSSVNGGPLSPSLAITVSPVELAPHEKKVIGYMPFRDDFEYEYNNSAEANISGLRVEADDDDLDSDFKIAFVDMYRHKIRERFRMHKIARNHGVINAIFTKSCKQGSPFTKKRLSREEREIKESLKAFAQFQTNAEKDKYHESLKKQKQLHQQIKDLMRYRRNGLSKLDECIHYDEDKYLRDKQKENKKKLCASPSKRMSLVSRKAEEESRSNVCEDGSSRVEDNDKEEKHEYDLLTDTEKRLVNSIGLEPSFYITIKTCILKDYLQRRQGVPVKVRYPMGMEKSHRLKIVNFLRASGWIGAV